MEPFFILFSTLLWNVCFAQAQSNATSFITPSITKSTPNDVTSQSMTSSHVTNLNPSSSFSTSDSRKASRRVSSSDYSVTQSYLTDREGMSSTNGESSLPWSSSTEVDSSEPSVQESTQTSVTPQLTASHTTTSFITPSITKSTPNDVTSHPMTSSHVTNLNPSSSFSTSDSRKASRRMSSSDYSVTQSYSTDREGMSSTYGESSLPWSSSTEVDSNEPSVQESTQTSVTPQLTASHTSKSSASTTYDVTKVSSTSVRSGTASVKPSVTPTTVRPTTKPPIPKENPRITTKSELSDVVLKEEDQLFIQCEAKGDPTPTVRWTKDGMPIDKSSVTILRGGLILVDSVTGRDTGIYTCIAENRAGRDTHTIHIKILYISDMVITFSKHNEKEPLEKVIEGDAIDITCRVQSYPRPLLVWEKNGRSLDEVSSMQISIGNRMYSSVISFANVKRKDHAGTYTCKGNQGKSRISKSKVLEIQLPVPPTYPPPKKLSKTSSTILVPVHKMLYLKNGVPIKYIQVIVLELQSNDIPRRSPSSYTSNELGPYKGNRTVPYIAGIFRVDEDVKDFEIGDGKTYSIAARKRRDAAKKAQKYHNVPLRPGKYYSAFQRMVGSDDTQYNALSWIAPTKTVETPTTYTADDNRIIIYCVIGVLVLLIVIACLVARVYVVKKRSSESIGVDKYEMNGVNGISPLERVARTFSMHMARISEHYHPPGPIPVDEFPNHVQRMHKSGDMLFSTEYERIRDDNSIPATQSLAPANQWKNRFTNIVAYDHNRVKLIPYDDEPASDFINASYIDGYQGRTYIATQGPLDETRGDFWRMVWEQNTMVIVMLTNIRERGRPKCSQYWPTSGSCKFEGAHISLVEEVELSSHTVRLFRVTMSGEDKPRLIKQFHFTSWPDHGVPKSVAFLLLFVRETTQANPPDAGPMVVHCSAGVGRTGTFIVVDTMLRQIAHDKTVNIYHYVVQLRKQRNLMVQTEQQYIFIHDALFDAIVSGDTEIPASRVRSHVQNITEISKETDENTLNKEFRRLTLGWKPRLMASAANHSANKRKNRYHNTLPFDDTRVMLSVQSAVAGSDYINASFIDGYKKKRAFIATQAPLPNTFSDFWRMIWEQECYTIVTLAQEMENTKQKMDRYWPTSHPITYGELQVESIEELKKESFDLRVLKITNTQDDSSRTIRQYHFIEWTSDDIMDSEVGLLSMIAEIDTWQEASDNHVITVHCSAGVGRTGVFCAVCSLVERLKAEALVDVFMTVKLLREQRPAMVQTKIQYEYCYELLLEYLDMHGSLEQLNSPIDTVQAISTPVKSPLSDAGSTHVTFDPIELAHQGLVKVDKAENDDDKTGIIKVDQEKDSDKPEEELKIEDIEGDTPQDEEKVNSEIIDTC